MLESKNIRFSVIIPAHNSEGFLHKAISSVKSQAFKDYELIVVCDACDDGTENVARAYADKVAVTNYGRDGLARQIGIDLSEGEFILFMDDDDWWIHEYVLQILNDYADQIDAFDVLCFGFIWKDKGYMGPVRYVQGGRRVLWPNVWSKMYRAEWLKKTGVRFGDARMISDLHFSRDLIARDPELAFLDQPLYYYNWMRVGSQTEREGK